MTYHELYQELLHGTTDLFDLVRMDMVWRPTFEFSLCTDLSPYRERTASFQSRFLDGIKKSYRQDSPESRVLPLDPSTQLLFYRRDLFENAAIQPKPIPIIRLINGGVRHWRNSRRATSQWPFPSTITPRRL